MLYEYYYVFLFLFYTPVPLNFSFCVIQVKGTQVCLKVNTMFMLCHLIFFSNEFAKIIDDGVPNISDI